MTRQISLMYSGTDVITLRPGEFSVVEARPAESLLQGTPYWFSELKSHMGSGLVVTPMATYLHDFEGDISVRMVNTNRSPKIIDAIVGSIESKDIVIAPGDVIGVLNTHKE